MKPPKGLAVAIEIGKGCAELVTAECPDPALRVLAAAVAALIAIRSTPEEDRPATAAALYQSAYAYCEYLSAFEHLYGTHKCAANPRSKPDKELLELRKLAGLQ